jgi:endonuclease/exonuclease/phosphatase family metal-dependent hydrolase
MSRFRVLQFNMQFGQVWDEADPDGAPVDVQRAIEEITRHDADIIMLQEVEQVGPGGRQIQPPPNFSRLQEALPGYDSYFAYPREDARELPFGIGLAIFSRTPLSSVFREDIPSPPVEFDFYGETKTPTDRVLIGARTTIDGREVGLINTHLLAFFMLKSSSETHGCQRAQVGELLRDAEHPTILSGDFNVSNTASLVEEYAKFGFQTVQTEEITWRRHPYVLDHIFHNASFRCVGHQVSPTTASDHHVLVADFEFAD